MVLVGEALNTTASAFNNQINTRNNALTQAGKLLSGDFAFKTAYASMREQTIRSALDNHRQRVGADLMLLLSLDGKTIAGSGQTAGSFIDEKNMFPFPDFIGRVMEVGEASGMVAQDNAIYSIIAVPLLTPVPSAWIILGFQVDDTLIRQLQQDSHAEVSIVTRSKADWKVGQTTLKTDATEALLNALQLSQPALGKTVDMQIDSSTWFTYISPLPHWGDTAIYAVLQRSSDDALAPYYRLRQLLLGLLVAALIISVIAGGAIASSVTRPVQALVSFAGQIQRGDYQQEVVVGQRDELGQLAQAFNDMTKGLRERDKVRNLLGKVISPEIAEELINKDVKLGGEEREMTILFTDLRNFTGLSEKRAPAEVLTLLIEYLTLMTAVIDKHGGVVDKYIGDAIMALFGAPLELPDHANRAVHCAIEMTQTLASMNRDFRARGLPELGMGIGVNSGNVVVGNMGSKDRLNYTVIGDNVNLASRLETVTKEYDVPVIVSEATRVLTADIEYRMLDRITVKGKLDAVTIYTPLISLE